MSRLVSIGELDRSATAAVRDIYEAAFPAELRADFDSLLDDRVLVRTDPAPQGLAVLRAMREGWWFLRYYAVGTRGGGVGTAMLGELSELLRSEGSPMLVWDVEDPDEAGLAPETAHEHRRRIAFYERAGGVLLPVRGYAPPHGDDLDGHAPRLRLMCLPLAGRPAGVREVLVTAMTDRYALPDDHPALLRALRESGLD